MFTESRKKRQHKNPFHLYICIFLFLFTSSTCTHADNQDYELNPIEITVYRDGISHVSQTFTVNETTPFIEVQLLSDYADNLLVLDENQTFLDYEIEGEGYNITIFSLGSKEIHLEYDTPSLTAKEAEVWTLDFSASHEATVLLPDNSAILYLSGIPTAINTENGRISLSLFPDRWEISYVLPTTIIATFEVSDLKITPNHVYPGEKVKISVKVTNSGVIEGLYTVVLKINSAEEDAKTITLGPGENEAVEFEIERSEPGTYIIEVDDLQDEFEIRNPMFPFPIEYLLTIPAAILLLSFLFMRRRNFNSKRLFKKHMDLRQEDKEVIEFLVEKRGKALETEIRERFSDFPRTSLWRLVRRLERLGIVKVKKIGLQNQIELNK